MRASLLLLLVACGSEPDDCELAVRRLERIHSEAGHRPPKSEVRDSMLAGCRAGAKDPVMRCALDARTDGAAAACIDEGMRGVVKPGDGTDGVGLNPLTQ